MRPMGKLSLSLFALGVAACGSDNKGTADAGKTFMDAKVFMDAPPKVFMDAPPPMFDFTCENNTAPTTAAANITVSGVVTQIDIQGTTPSISTLDGATLDGCKTGAANCTGPNQYGTEVTSANGGTFAIGPFATGGVPVDAFVTMTKTGDRAARVYPASPVAADLPNMPVLTFTDTAFAALNQFLQLGQQAGNGTLAIYVTDCANTPISDSANITLSVKQGGNPVANTKTVDAGALSSMAAGIFIVSNVPPGDTEIGATYKTHTLRAHTIGVVAATTSETIVRPGF